MRLRIFIISCLILYVISLLVSIGLFVLSIIFTTSTDFYLTPIACGASCVISLLLLIMSIKNFNKNTCALVDLAYEKNMSINKAAFIGSIVVFSFGIISLIGGILLIVLLSYFTLGLALLALANFIIINLILYYIYMYVEIHY